MATKTYTTYMRVTLNSEGAAPTNVTTALKKLGWAPTFGQYDYVYNWGDTWGTDYTNVEKVLPNFDGVHTVLKGLGVGYNFVTYEYGTEPWVGNTGTGTGNVKDTTY